MARMPQIPEPRISERPDGRVGEAPQLNVNAITAPVEDAAAAMSHAGDALEAAQAQRDAEQAKLQKVYDQTDAIARNGKFEEQARDIATQLQAQYWDNPSAFSEQYRKAVQQLSESQLQDPTLTSGAAMELMPRNARSLNSAVLSGQSWAIGRTAQKIKDSFTKISQGVVEKAGSQLTLNGLSAVLKDWKSAPVDNQGNASTVAQLAGTVHGGNASAHLEKVSHDARASYIEAKISRNPSAAIADLAASNSPLRTGPGALSSEEVAKYQKRAAAEIVNAGNAGFYQDLKRDDSWHRRIVSAYQNGDLDGRLNPQLREELLQDRARIEADPNQDAKTKAARLRQNDANMETLTHWSELAQRVSQTGLSYDASTARKLQSAVADLSAPESPNAGDLLKVMELRHDIAGAIHGHKISFSRGITMLNSLDQLVPAGIAKEKNNVGWTGPFGGEHRTPRQAGNVVLQDAFKKGKYARFTPEQQALAFDDYFEALVNITNNAQRQPTEEEARTAAAKALKHVAGF